MNVSAKTMEHQRTCISGPGRTQTYHLRSAGLQVLLPSDPQFVESQGSYWSLSAQPWPACIVLPRSVHDVAAAILLLAEHGWKFTVRSGGHTPHMSKETNGVTLDLRHMNNVHVNEEDGTADIGPGARWKDVYAELNRHGRMVAGGREGNVGVGGLILGGGNTFLTAREGFACDTVIAFEVALADGRIITADSQRHSDLFWALKGGSNNFGVVTNFKMKTFEGSNIWGGVTLYPKHTSPQVIQNLTMFTDAVHTMLDTNMLWVFTYTGTSCPKTMFDRVLNDKQ